MDSKKKEVLSLLTELIKFAKSDKQYRESEHRFLLAVSFQLGVSLDEFESLFESNINFTPPKKESERILQFQRLVLLMNIDNEVSEIELHKIKDFGIRLGLHPDAISEVLSEMKNHEDSLIPADKLIAIFRVHHN